MNVFEKNSRPKKTISANDGSDLSAMFAAPSPEGKLQKKYFFSKFRNFF
jgi:hypothetical protein